MIQNTAWVVFRISIWLRSFQSPKVDAADASPLLVLKAKKLFTVQPSPPPPLWLRLCVWSNPKPAKNVRHFKMNQTFKVVRGHPYWCRQESRTVCSRNVQLMPTLFLKLSKIWQRENGKFVDFNDPTQAWRRPSKKRLRISTKFILPETGITDLHFCRW